VVLQLDSISSNGKSYSLQTDQYRKEGSSRTKSTEEKVGGGAILEESSERSRRVEKALPWAQRRALELVRALRLPAKVSNQVALRNCAGLHLQAPVTVVKSADPTPRGQNWMILIRPAYLG